MNKEHIKGSSLKLLLKMNSSDRPLLLTFQILYMDFFGSIVLNKGLNLDNNVRKNLLKMKKDESEK